MPVTTAAIMGADQHHNTRTSYLYASYDATRMTKAEAWEQLKRDFPYTFLPPTTTTDGELDYRECNPWERSHEYGDELRPRRWRWSILKAVLTYRAYRNAAPRLDFHVPLAIIST